VAVACKTPVPVSETVWGLVLALSVIVRVPVRAPVVVGVKVTLTVQVAPGASVVPQVFVWAKSPDTTTEEKFTAIGVPALRVTIFATLVVSEA
jgi:hypothetical protein